MEFTPNDQQRAVFDFELAGDGNVQVSARAGTGKTKTLVELLPYTTGKIFLGAYNKRIAEELDYKIRRRHSEDIQRRVTVKTQHAMGLAAFSGAPGQNRPDIKGDKMRLVLDHLSENNEVYIKYRAFLLSLISKAKLSGFGVKSTFTSFPEITDVSAWESIIDHFRIDEELRDGNADINSLITVAQGLYVQSLDYCKKAGGPFRKPTVDFDDMLLAPLFFGVKYPKFDRVLIDEAQDNSDVRTEQGIRMLEPDGRLIVVGDPYQAIYGFTGANCDSMRLIEEKMKCTVLPLTVTYRCGKLIVKEAQQWVPDIEAHETSPDGFVGECFLDTEGNPNQVDFMDLGPFTADDAILCRNTKPLISLAYEFIRKGIPAKIEGRDIGYGLKALATRWKIRELDQLESKLGEWVEAEVDKWQKKRNEKRAEEAREKAETLYVLILATRERGGYSIQDLTNLIDSIFADTEAGEAKCLTLSTIHKSKGREWPRVFILGMEKYQPSKWAKQDWEQQQERNLMYVAVTRAMSTLYYLRVPEKPKQQRAGAMVSQW